MSIPHLTSSLIKRIDRFNAAFHAVRMGAAAALPGNPFGIEILTFGTGYGIACKVRHPLLRGKNRVIGFTSGDIGSLDMLLDYYRSEGLPFSLSVQNEQMTASLFCRLADAGLWSSGSGTVPAITPDGYVDDVALLTPSEIVVRVSGPQERELYLDLFQQAFADRSECTPEYRAFQWAEDALANGQRYIAEIDGKSVGMASFPIVNGVGFFGTAGVLPEHRGRGVQTALIRRRIADARALGCDLILGGGSPGSTTYRNFERAGLRLIPTSMAWVDIRPG